MNIQNTSNLNFKGYDARRLKGFFMCANPGGIIDNMQYIGRKEGFDIYSKVYRNGEIICDKAIADAIPYKDRVIWSQDVWTFTKDKLLTSQSKVKSSPISTHFNLKKVDNQKHISGGNIFITNNNGIDELFIGEKELEKVTIPELKEKYNTEKIHILPQMDYHLDLFIRPLDNKKILVADDNLTLEVLEKGKYNFFEFMSRKNLKNNPIAQTILFNFEHIIDSFKHEINENDLPQTNIIAQKVLKAGYEAIKVPGRIYQTCLFEEKGKKPQTFLSHDCNYMNANVLKNKDGDLVYITNKSNIDKQLMIDSSITRDFNFSLEKEFAKSIEQYVKPEKVYFIDGEDNYVSQTMLKKMQGGIHCTCSEIPE